MAEACCSKDCCELHFLPPNFVISPKKSRKMDPERVDQIIREVLNYINSYQTGENLYPQLEHLDKLAESGEQWLGVIKALVRTVPMDSRLGASTITIVFDFAKHLHLKQKRADNACETADSIYEELNVLVVISYIAERFRGPQCPKMLSEDVLGYLTTFIVKQEEPTLVIHALIAIEKFIYNKECKDIIENYFSKQAFHPLIPLDLHYGCPNYLWRQVGFFTRWALDNTFEIPGRRLSQETQDMRNINVVLNKIGNSEYLKISADGLEVRSDSHAFDGVRATFKIDRGCWYYEVELVTSGVMQIGWVTKDATLQNHEGSGGGDDQFSLAYDGCRRMVWHCGRSEPGPFATADPGACSKAEPGAGSSPEPEACSTAEPGANTTTEPGAYCTAEPGSRSSAEPVACSSAEQGACSSAELGACSTTEPGACAYSTAEPGACSTAKPGTLSSAEPEACSSAELGAGSSGEMGAYFSAELGACSTAEPGAWYMAKPGASYLHEPGASYKNEPGASYKNEPGASYKNEPGASYMAEQSASYMAEQGASYMAEPGASYTAEPGASYMAEPGAYYSAEPNTWSQAEPWSSAEPNAWPTAELSAWSTSEPGAWCTAVSRFTAKPGTFRWEAGDTLGCLIDIGRQEAIFTHNGRRLLVRSDIFAQTRTTVDSESGACSEGIYPAASFMAHQQCRFNFGASPFKHPPLERTFEIINQHGSLTEDENNHTPGSE